MREIGISEAKNKLANLLAQVERGAEILITRRGHPVAKLVSAHAGVNQDKAQAASDRIRQRAKTLKDNHFRWEEWKKYRDEGRIH